MQVWVNGLGGLVENSCNELGGACGEGIGRFREDAVHNPTFRHFCGVRTDWVDVELPRRGGIAGSAASITDILRYRGRGFVLLVVLNE